MCFALSARVAVRARAQQSGETTTANKWQLVCGTGAQSYTMWLASMRYWMLCARRSRQSLLTTVLAAVSP